MFVEANIKEVIHVDVDGGSRLVGGRAADPKGMMSHVTLGRYSVFVCIHSFSAKLWLFEGWVRYSNDHILPKFDYGLSKAGSCF